MPAFVAADARPWPQWRQCPSATPPKESSSSNWRNQISLPARVLAAPLDPTVCWRASQWKSAARAAHDPKQKWHDAAGTGIYAVDRLEFVRLAGLNGKDRAWPPTP